jgi:hypothetical protein
MAIGPSSSLKTGAAAPDYKNTIYYTPQALEIQGLFPTIQPRKMARPKIRQAICFLCVLLLCF